ncbi:hypothetical protein D3H55_05060 [Bacillus salacetis]|uniref:Uncharacterized protein n=1 Tax=Bacillus salacetis TaxID=2315464 RepID=A0A3A1R5L5_9BACI|nr:hypothetical protein D3H55_05060 [Bacillus salacetis]
MKPAGPLKRTYLIRGIDKYFLVWADHSLKGRFTGQGAGEIKPDSVYLPSHLVIKLKGTPLYYFEHFVRLKESFPYKKKKEDLWNV